MGRDRAVVDDAPATRVLALHHAERLLRAEERTGQVDRNDIRPLLQRQFLDRDVAGACAGVVEQKIDPPIGRRHRIEQCCNRSRVRNVGRHHKHPRRRCLCERSRLLEHFAATSGEHHREPVREQRKCRRAADAAARSGDDRYLSRRRHAAASQ